MYDYKAKTVNTRISNCYTLAKTRAMFSWHGLPNTIPANELEKILQVHGYAFITKVNGELYALTGGLGGEPDVYKNPTKIVIAEPALNYNATLSIKNDGVLIYNDPEKIGLYPVINKYNTLMTENEITLTLRGFTSRMQRLLAASDDKTKTSAERYLEKIIDGELGVIGESALLDGIKSLDQNADGASAITALVELQQYYRGLLHNELGLGTNFNMKRERLTDDEILANNDAIHPLIDVMKLCRESAIEELNSKYGLSISISYGSIWEHKNEILNQETLDEPTHEPTREPTHEPEGNNQSLIEEIKIILGGDLDDAERAEWEQLLDRLKNEN